MTHTRDSICLTVRCGFGFLAAVLLAVVPGAGAAENNSDVAIVDAKNSLAPLNLSVHDQKRVKELLDKLPPDHKLEVECTTFAPGGTAVRYICRLTSLNAAGKPDGQEINYRDWYQHASRIALYRNGVRDGVEKQFDVAGGFVTSETPWVKGVIDGVKRTYHPNGKPANETTYAKGEATGISRSYTADGQVSRTVIFVNGERDGDAIDYWTDKPDAVERIVPYRKGKVEGVAKAFYLSGKLKWERPFKDNRQHGIEKQYSIDGAVDKTLYWLNGSQVTAEEYAKKAKK